MPLTGPRCREKGEGKSAGSMQYSKRFLLISAAFFLQLSDLCQLQGNHNGIFLPFTDCERARKYTESCHMERGKGTPLKGNAEGTYTGMQMLQAAVMQRGACSES